MDSQAENRIRRIGEIKAELVELASHKKKLDNELKELMSEVQPVMQKEDIDQIDISNHGFKLNRKPKVKYPSISKKFIGETADNFFEANNITSCKGDDFVSFLYDRRKSMGETSESMSITAPKAATNTKKRKLNIPSQVDVADDFYEDLNL